MTMLGSRMDCLYDEEEGSGDNGNEDTEGQSPSLLSEDNVDGGYLASTGGTDSQVRTSNDVMTLRNVTTTTGERKRRSDDEQESKEGAGATILPQPSAHQEGRKLTPSEENQQQEKYQQRRPEQLNHSSSPSWGKMIVEKERFLEMALKEYDALVCEENARTNNNNVSRRMLDKVFFVEVLARVIRKMEIESHWCEELRDESSESLNDTTEDISKDAKDVNSRDGSCNTGSPSRCQDQSPTTSDCCVLSTSSQNGLTLSSSITSVRQCQKAHHNTTGHGESEPCKNVRIAEPPDKIAESEGRPKLLDEKSSPTASRSPAEAQGQDGSATEAGEEEEREKEETTVAEQKATKSNVEGFVYVDLPKEQVDRSETTDSRSAQHRRARDDRKSRRAGASGRKKTVPTEIDILAPADPLSTDSSSVSVPNALKHSTIPSPSQLYENMSYPLVSSLSRSSGKDKVGAKEESLIQKADGRHHPDSAGLLLFTQTAVTEGLVGRSLKVHQRKSESASRGDSRRGQGDMESVQIRRQKVSLLLDQAECTRFPFKKKLSLNNLGLSADDIPLGELCGTGLGKSLQKLSLAGNRLATVPPLLVRSLPVLKTLDLSQCELNLLPNQWHLPKLTTLNLSHNRLTDFPDESMLEGLRDLRELNMYGNRIAEIVVPENPSKLCKLETLNLGYNDLVFLPDALDQLPSLKVLKVMNNFLAKVPMRLCEMDLQKLDVTSNPVTEPPIETCERGIGPMRRYWNCVKGEEQSKQTSRSN